MSVLYGSLEGLASNFFAGRGRCEGGEKEGHFMSPRRQGQDFETDGASPAWMGASQRRVRRGDDVGIRRRGESAEANATPGGQGGRRQAGTRENAASADETTTTGQVRINATASCRGRRAC
jgi:hypothetical protein